MSRIRDLWRTDRGGLVHYLVAVALSLFLVLNPEFGLPGQLFALAAIPPLILSRNLPFAGPLVVGGALAGMFWVDPFAAADDVVTFLLLFMAWCLGTYNGRAKAVVGLVAYELLGIYASSRYDAAAGDYFWIAVWIGVAWTAGSVLNRRAALARDMTTRAGQLEREQAAAAERAVAEERQRIARELHDVIAHSVSVMTVQAGAARRLLRPEQAKERDALLTVESAGRQALTEMRRLVGLLREQGAMPEFSPQPGLGTIESLLDGVRAAGLPVELEVEGSPHELPPGVDLAAYRVVQEALTNALKYAGPAHAWVRITWEDDELGLEIANDGRSDGGATGGGQGLDGMRERVSLYGGEIASGPRDGGGFVVRARLPIGEAAA